MENGVLPAAVRSAERALESRYSTYLDEARRLIMAGFEELRATGSVEPRVADIVRRAGLSNKAFYRHFRSKDELLLAVLEEGMRLRVEEFERVLAGADSALERVRLWIWGVLEQAMNPEMAAATRPLLVYQGRLLESLGPQLWGHRDRLVEPLKRALVEARDNGELPSADPEVDSDIVYHVAMGWMHGRVIARITPLREEAERIVEFAMRGLQAAGQ